jgi:hypothetical protein
VSPRGCSKTCNKSKKRKCLLFTVNERKEIFNRFWTMTWDEKRVFVCSLVEQRDVKQRTLDTDSRRNCSFLYFLRKENAPSSFFDTPLYCLPSIRSLLLTFLHHSSFFFLFLTGTVSSAFSFSSIPLFLSSPRTRSAVEINW